MSSDDSNAGETGKIQEALSMLPKGISYAIVSNDITRLSLIGKIIFGNSNVFNDGTGPNLLCFMVDVMEDYKGGQILTDGKWVTEDDISEKSGEKLSVSKDSDEEIESSDGIIEFINCTRERKRQSPSGQFPCLPEENMVEEFIQKLKDNNIYRFSDNEVKVDNLQGKTLAIILIDQNDPECRRLQQIYDDIKLKHSDFEAIWIPLWEEENFGFGTYSRAIEYMPWLSLADPTLIKIDDIKDRSPSVIIINSEGSIGNTNALGLLMCEGADAYPFTKESLSQLDSQSSLEILFHSTEIKELNNKLIFLYAETPSRKLRMKSSLEKLVQIHGEGSFEIVYVGSYFAGRNDAESLQKEYEDATQSMNWTKLSFEDMMRFWYRCKYLSDEVVQESNTASTLNRLREALVNEGSRLVVVDGDGMVTANGIDVVEMACELSDDKDDEVGNVMKEELRQSLKEGKCSEGVRMHFRDELKHPQHRHPLRTWKEDTLYPKDEFPNEFYCNVCDLARVYSWYERRMYRCDDCCWDLCWDCWKEFVEKAGEKQEAVDI